MVLVHTGDMHPAYSLAHVPAVSSAVIWANARLPLAEGRVSFTFMYHSYRRRVYILIFAIHGARHRTVRPIGKQLPIAHCNTYMYVC